MASTLPIRRWQGLPSDLLELVVGSVGVAMLASGADLRINLSPSLPVGLYRTVSGGPTPGALVLVCVPGPVGRLALTRGYVPRGGCPGRAMPIGKLVLGLAGDTITLSPTGVVLNGRSVANSAVQSRDSEGRPLEHHPYGTHVLEQGELWLFSPHPRSFDSRYFGPVAAAGVRARVEPLWTIGGERGD